MEGERPPQERDNEIINEFQSLDRNIERIEAIAAQNGLEMVITNQDENAVVFYFKNPNGDATVPPEDMLDVFGMILTKTDFTLHEIATQNDNVVEIRAGVIPERYSYIVTRNEMSPSGVFETARSIAENLNYDCAEILHNKASSTEMRFQVMKPVTGGRGGNLTLISEAEFQRFAELLREQHPAHEISIETTPSPHILVKSQ